jgi:hypothetical protein
MTSFKQFAANRQNAVKSTGPRTREGKARSSRNALRHGLTAETVVEALEDARDYRAFEAGILSEYSPQGAVERELVLRLASLLWRLRRATLIESGLIETQAEILEENRKTLAEDATLPSANGHEFAAQILGPNAVAHFAGDSTRERQTEPAPDLSDLARFYPPGASSRERDLSLCFLRLANFDNGAFERVGRHERASGGRRCRSSRSRQ